VTCHPDTKLTLGRPEVKQTQGKRRPNVEVS